MFCDDGFTAEGAVRLAGATIAFQFSLVGATLRNPGGDALVGVGLTVRRGMFCRDGFTADGAVDLSNATIEGTLSLRDASLNNPDGTALDLKGAQVGDLRLQPAHPPRGDVDLTNARIGTVHDVEETWQASLQLRGCTYERLENHQIGVRARLRWLQRNRDGYAPQPYDQLAAAYRRSGQPEAARRVGVAKQWRRRSALNPLNWLLYVTVGYGYRTWLAACWLAVLTVVGTQVFSRAHAPHPIGYTLDLLVPIVDLGQRKAFTPQGWALSWSWAFIAAGWMLTTAAVAGLTGIFKRD
jgi:hypothetical protein